MDPTPRSKVLAMIQHAIDTNSKAPTEVEFREIRPYPKSSTPSRLACEGIIIIEDYSLLGHGHIWRVIEYNGGRTQEPPPGSRLIKTTRPVPRPDYNRVKALVARAEALGVV